MHVVTVLTFIFSGARYELANQVFETLDEAEELVYSALSPVAPAAVDSRINILLLVAIRLRQRLNYRYLTRLYIIRNFRFLNTN